MQIEQCTNRSHGFVRPDCISQTSSIDDSCCTDCRKQKGTSSGDPWQCHAHFGHPVAIVLAVRDGVDNLEVPVAPKADEHHTHLTGCQGKDVASLQRA